MPRLVSAAVAALVLCSVPFTAAARGGPDRWADIDIEFPHVAAPALIGIECPTDGFLIATLDDSSKPGTATMTWYAVPEPNRPVPIGSTKVTIVEVDVGHYSLGAYAIEGRFVEIGPGIHEERREASARSGRLLECTYSAFGEPNETFSEFWLLYGTVTIRVHGQIPSTA